MIYVTDTHGLIWFLTDDSNLGKNAKAVFEKADKGEEIIIIPTIVLAEILYISEKKKIGLKFNTLLEKLKTSFNYVPYDLNLEVIIQSQEYKTIPELHDKVIVATAKLFNAKLITKDSEIKDSKLIECVW